jgi:hypothetical protein
MIISMSIQDAIQVLTEMAASIRADMAMSPQMPEGERIDHELNATACEMGIYALRQLHPEVVGK